MSLEEIEELRNRLLEANQDLMNAIDKWIVDPTPENKAEMENKQRIQEPINKEFWEKIGI